MKCDNEDSLLYLFHPEEFRGTYPLNYIFQFVSNCVMCKITVSALCLPLDSKFPTRECYKLYTDFTFCLSFWAALMMFIMGPGLNWGTLHLDPCFAPLQKFLDLSLQPLCRKILGISMVLCVLFSVVLICIVSCVFSCLSAGSQNSF